MSTAAVTSIAAHEQRLHPLPLRIMHWSNAVAIFIMIGSGWKIYNDDVIFGILHFPDSVVIGKWAQYARQWHRHRTLPAKAVSDFGQGVSRDGRRRTAASPGPRRPDALQRRAKDSL